MGYKLEARDYHLTESGWSTSEVSNGSRVKSWRLSVYQESSWSEGTAIAGPHLAQSGIPQCTVAQSSGFSTCSLRI